MTTNSSQENQEQKQNDKELNFRALESKYQRQLEQERQARLEAEKKAQELAASRQNDSEEEDDEPYVDHKKLKKTMNTFGQSTKSEIEKAMESAKATAKEEIKNELWLENNPDFFDVMKHAERFAQRAPKIAESILKMPDGFERQKLVYHNIKELGIDKPEAKQSSIQEKIDANRRSPYYQPSGVGTAPYNAGTGDFSPSGQKAAYDKLQQLKKQLRI